MINELPKINFQEIKEMLDKNKTVKIVAYIGIGLLGFYVLGKVCKVMAITIRDLNELKSAINGK